jgi:protein SCO1/2
MFAILAVGWRRGMSGLFRHARRSPAVAAVLIGLGTGTVVMVSGVAVRVQQARAGAELAVVAGGIPPATYPRLDRAAPPLVLVAHTGETFDLAALAGRPVLVTFAYAHCATVCPVIVKHTLDAQAALRGTVHDAAAVVVTLDPWRDTPSRLPAMARQWGLPDRDAWILSGAVHDVEAVLDAWNIPRSRDLATGEVTHPSLVYVIDRAGRIAYASTGGTDALIALVQRL